MSDENRDELVPEIYTEPTNDAPMLEEISDDELDTLSGGGDKGKDPTVPNLFKLTSTGAHIHEAKIT